MKILFTVLPVVILAALIYNIETHKKLETQICTSAVVNKYIEQEIFDDYLVRLEDGKVFDVGVNAYYDIEIGDSIKYEKVPNGNLKDITIFENYIKKEK